MSIGPYQERRDTAANWATNNPTLLAGLKGFETDTGKWKIGPGAWNSLPYLVDLHDVENIAEMQAISRIKDGDHVLVAGYHTTAIHLTPDFGGGRFVYRASSTDTHDGGAVFTATGMGVGRYHRIFENGEVSVAQFGAKGLNTGDDTAAIQAAVDYAIYRQPSYQNSGMRKVKMHAGRFPISNTIHLGYGTGGSYTSITLEGAGPRYDESNEQQTGTTLELTVRDRMALNIQGARMTRLKGFSVSGMYNYILGQGLGYNVIDNDKLEATWKDPNTTNFPASAYAQFSAYAGITVDAYCGAQPATRYPDVTYPSFLGGGISQYNKNPSSDVLLEDVTVDSFVVGFAHHPCQFNSNGEFTHWKNGQINGCLRGVAIGHTQHRNLELDGINFAECYTCIDNQYVGFKSGQMQGVIDNCHFGGCYSILNGQAAFGGSMTLRGCYAEVIGRLGDHTATGDGNSLTLDNCFLDFREVADERFGVPENHTSGADCKLNIINGTRFRTRYGFVTSFGGTTSVLNLGGSMSEAFNATTDSLPASFVPGTGGFMHSTSRVNITLNYHNAGNGQWYSTTAEDWNDTYAPYFVRRGTYAPQTGAAQGGTFSYPTPELTHPVYRGTNVTLINRSGKNVELPGGRLAYAPSAAFLPLDLGDALKIGNTWFTVTSFNGSNCVLTQLTNYYLTAAGSVFTNTGTSDNPSAPINCVIFTRLQNPKVGGQLILLAGTATSGTDTLTNVKNVLSDANQWNSDGVAVNDWAVFSDPEMANIGGNSAARLQKLVAFDRTLKTLTFNSNLPFSKGCVVLPWWVKTLTP